MKILFLFAFMVKIKGKKRGKFIFMFKQHCTHIFTCILGTIQKSIDGISQILFHNFMRLCILLVFLMSFLRFVSGIATVHAEMLNKAKSVLFHFCSCMFLTVLGSSINHLTHLKWHLYFIYQTYPALIQSHTISNPVSTCINSSPLVIRLAETPEQMLTPGVNRVYVINESETGKSSDFTAILFFFYLSRSQRPHWADPVSHCFHATSRADGISPGFCACVCSSSLLSCAPESSR